MTWMRSKDFNKETLVTFALCGFFNRVYRSYPMPHLLEGLKMSGDDQFVWSMALIGSTTICGGVQGRGLLGLSGSVLSVWGVLRLLWPLDLRFWTRNLSPSSKLASLSNRNGPDRASVHGHRFADRFNAHVPADAFSLVSVASTCDGRRLGNVSSVKLFFH